MFDHLVTPSGGKIAESVSDLAKRTGHAEEQVDGMLRKLDDERIPCGPFGRARADPSGPGATRSSTTCSPRRSTGDRGREEHRRVRRVRRLAALAVALLVIVSAVAAVFAYLLNSANTEKLTAEIEASSKLAADADLNMARDPELSTSLALQALQLHSTSQAEDALWAALPGLQVLRTFTTGPRWPPRRSIPPTRTRWSAPIVPASPGSGMSGRAASGAPFVRWLRQDGASLRGGLQPGRNAGSGAGRQSRPFVVVFDTHTGRIITKTANLNGSVL